MTPFEMQRLVSPEVEMTDDQMEAVIAELAYDTAPCGYCDAPKSKWYPLPNDNGEYICDGCFDLWAQVS